MNGKLDKKPKPKMSKKNFRKKSFRKKKKLILRRFSLVVACLLIVFAGFFGIYFLLSKIFSIKNILVQGSTDYSDAEIISAGELEQGKSMLFLNSKDIENKIYKSLPNIDDVKISKKLPNKLIISVENATPAYYLKNENEYLIISARNKFLSTSSEPPEGIAGVIGIGVNIEKNGKLSYKNAELGHLCEEILNSFKDKGIDSISEIDVSDIQNIKLLYDNRIRINIGNKDDVDYKILTLKEIINTKISKTEKGVLNLKDIKTENRTYFTSE